MRVAVLHNFVRETDGPDEQDNLRQAEAVARALTLLGHEVRLVPFPLDARVAIEGLRAFSPRAVFNLVETVEGLGRLGHFAPGILEELGLPFTGGGSFPMFVTADKLRTKRLLRAACLPTPAWFTLAAARRRKIALSGRFIVKPVYEHGSVGIDEDCVVAPADSFALAEAADRLSRGRECFAEAFVEGREFNISLLDGPGGLRVLPPAEIEFVGYGADKPRVVGYRAKWAEDSFEFAGTVRRFEFPASDAGLLSRIEAATRACWPVFELSCYARVDFRIDEAGRPLVIDVNPNPCLTPDAGFPAAAERAGIGYEALVGAILDRALAGPRGEG